MLEQYDYLYKIVLIGDSGVGKTNILLRHTQNTFFPDSKPTIGVEFDAKTYKFPEAIVKAQIWDTAGQERYRAITSAYYRGTMGALLVYDVTRPVTLDNCLQYWLIQLKEHGDPRMRIMLVGNQTDRVNDRQVTYEQGREVAERNNMLFFETSAKMGDKVEDAFKHLVGVIFEKNKNDETKKVKKGLHDGIMKTKAIKKLKSKKKSGCC